MTRYPKPQITAAGARVQLVMYLTHLASYYPQRIQVLTPDEICRQYRVSQKVAIAELGAARGRAGL